MPNYADDTSMMNTVNDAGREKKVVAARGTEYKSLGNRLAEVIRM